MATDEKRFDALGQSWTARFDFNSICALEERYDRPFLALVAPFLGAIDEQDADNPEAHVKAAALIKFSDLRAIFHQCLVSAQPSCTVEDAGDIISDVGLEQAMGVVGWAIAKAMPTGGEGAATANPPKRARRAN